MAAEFRSRGRGSARKVYPVSAPAPRLARSTDPKWIQASDNPKHNGYVREYMMDHYGPEAFTESGTIRMDYLEKAIQETHDRHEITWEKRLVRARTLKSINKDDPPAKPYGITKPEAEKEVHKLREDGEHARLIETNRKKELYAPYEGTLKGQAPPEKPAQRVTSTKRIPKETIEIREKGEKPFIAKITGPDKTYHYKREFIEQLRTSAGGSRKHPIKEVYFKGDLPYGTIVDTEDWSAIVVPRSERYPNGLRKFGIEGMTNRLKTNKLFEAREKSGYAEKIEV